MRVRDYLVGEKKAQSLGGEVASGRMTDDDAKAKIRDSVEGLFRERWFKSWYLPLSIVSFGLAVMFVGIILSFAEIGVNSFVLFGYTTEIGIAVAQSGTVLLVLGVLWFLCQLFLFSWVSSKIMRHQKAGYKRLREESDSLRAAYDTDVAQQELFTLRSGGHQPH